MQVLVRIDIDAIYNAIGGQKKTRQQGERETKRLLDKILPVVGFVSVVFLMYTCTSRLELCLHFFERLFFIMF